VNISLWLDDKKYQLKIEEKEKKDIIVVLGKKRYRVSVEFINKQEILLKVNSKIYNVMISSNTRTYSVFVTGKCYQIEKKSVRQILGDSPDKLKKKDVITSMPGKIVKIFAKEGEMVERGQPILILEAMKMQNEIKSPQAGKLISIKPKPGLSVEAGAVLFSVE
jgi:biotin carboxyl carrier protein